MSDNTTFNRRMRTKAILYKGISCWPDWAFSGTRWGKVLSAIGDVHDDLYGRACPKQWADEGCFKDLTARFKLTWIGNRFYWCLRTYVSELWYKHKGYEIWDRKKLNAEINAAEVRIRAKYYPENVRKNVRKNVRGNVPPSPEFWTIDGRDTE